ncbi:MAG TPA: DNA-binding protein [Tahibacter sp.]|nr:DNA-binding protein [Tahibacter sp.]
MATTRQTTGQDFADRLDQALTLAGIPRGRSRNGRLATLFYVSRETARLWLKGRLPALPKLHEMSRRLDVSLDWLATGRGHPRLSGTGEKNLPAGDAVEIELFNLIRLMTPKRKRALLALLTSE